MVCRAFDCACVRNGLIHGKVGHAVLVRDVLARRPLPQLRRRVPLVQDVLVWVGVERVRHTEQRHPDDEATRALEHVRLHADRPGMDRHRGWILELLGVVTPDRR
jgi:hypothetical protein